ncbi:MAG TPA: polysaccharide deacetylase family protein [Stellaceae bacterium]|nr:polysaccharide deacetylase family protein [Stellaceae bacterium]
MSNLPCVDTATEAGWSDLVDELDRWGAAGRVATMWWRDDDAVTATPQLDSLLHLAGGVPIALAVIPALALPDLANALSGAPQVAVLQHGWQHVSHAGRGKKSEYPEGRSAAVVEAEIGAGRARLKALFGCRALPVFVPPWNRFAAEFVPLLRRRGIAVLSAMARAPAAALPAGLAAIDVHLDVVAWRGDRGFVGTGAALAALIGHLRAGRVGETRATGPVGILTHHRVMDGATATFLGRLVELTCAHAAVRWVSAAAFVR